MRVPKAIVAPSIQIRRPRLDVLEHSAWYVGIVEVFIPLPTPVITRPTMNWAKGTCPTCRWPVSPHDSEYYLPMASSQTSAVTCMITPNIITRAPRRIDQRRPSQSPAPRMKTAPTRQPIGRSGKSALAMMETICKLTDFIDSSDSSLHGWVIVGCREHPVKRIGINNTAHDTLYVLGSAWNR